MRQGPAPARPSGTAMIRFFLRFIGLCLLAMAFVSLVYDGTKSIANQQLIYMKVSEAWAIVDQNSLLALEPFVEKRAPAWVWSPVTTSVLDAPTWLVLGVIASGLILLGRKRRPLIGYARD